MNLILNVLWLVFGGLVAAAAWLLAAAIFAVSIVGLPWARAAFNIALFTLLPFGHVAIRRDELTGRADLGTGPLGTLGNVVWLVLAGLWLAILHVFAALALAVTIIGIPFAWQHVKLAAMGLWPIGMAVVPSELANAARRDALGHAAAWRR
jgi:uncharacterized membrane protein YccF (DUF307 family)